MSIGLIDITTKIRHRKRLRTTLSLDDEVLGLIKRHAESRSLGLGKAVSELVRRGLATAHAELTFRDADLKVGATRRWRRTANGLRVFDLPADSPRVTRKKIEEIESEDL
jgi:hypothetical protein